MGPSETNTSRSCKYIVAPRLGRWRVTYEAASIGTFDDAADATRFACDVARMEAQAGATTVVVVHAPIQEMHCFTPPLGRWAPAPGSRLRLVRDAG
jgi:hypothetical protein